MLSCLHKQAKSQFETTRNALFGTPTIESLIGNNKRARVLQEFLLLNAIGRGDLDARPPLKGCFLMFNVIQADFMTFANNTLQSLARNCREIIYLKSCHLSFGCFETFLRNLSSRVLQENQMTTLLRQTTALTTLINKTQTLSSCLCRRFDLL
jgi:hypothetical protein